jgi:glycosyltransferase involved in cell wall biosynthesis
MLTRWESYIDTYASNLMKLGHSCVKFVPSFLSSQIAVYEHRLGHKVFRVPCATLQAKTLNWRIGSIAFTKELLKQKVVRQSDILHYNSYYSSFFLASELLLPSRIKITTQYSGGILPYSKDRIRNAVILAAFSHRIRSCNAVLIDGSSMEFRSQIDFLTNIARVRRSKIQDFSIVPVDSSLFKVTEKSEARRVLNLNSDKLIIVSITSVMEEPENSNEPTKNPFFLVRVFKRILELSGHEVELHIVGGGTGLQKLRKLVHELGIGKSVKIHGVVTHELIPMFISASDLVFVPYPFYDLKVGTVVMEAFSCKRPVAGFRKVQSASIDCEGGFLVDLDISKASKQIADRVLDRSYLMKKVEEGSRIAEMHAAPKLASRMEEIFANLS